MRRRHPQLALRLHLRRVTAMQTTNLPDPGIAVQRGLVVFPLPPGGKAAEKGWQHTIVTGDVDQVRAAWPAGANVGVACRASGIIGIDLDRRTSNWANISVDGIAQFERMCRRWGQKRPVTLEVRTPNDGRHLLLRVPDGVIVRSVSGGTSRLGPGIDIRGTGVKIGGYLVGPSSIVDDRAYEIEVDAPIAVLPNWLIALIGRRTAVAQ